MEEFLDPKTQLLVAVGAATAAKCQGCFAKLYGLAGNAGVSEKEIRAAVTIARKVSAKSDDFMAVFIEATTQGSVPLSTASGPSGTAGCGCT